MKCFAFALWSAVSARPNVLYKRANSWLVQMTIVLFSDNSEHSGKTNIQFQKVVKTDKNET